MKKVPKAGDIIRILVSDYIHYATVVAVDDAFDYPIKDSNGHQWKYNEVEVLGD